MLFNKKIFEKYRLSLKMWLEYKVLEIRIGEQNGRERGLRGVLF